MRTAVIIGPIAVTTGSWEEAHADATHETGRRIHLRRVRGAMHAGLVMTRATLDDRPAG